MGCKVDTLVERHALTVPDPEYGSLDEYLVARWTGADGHSADGYKPLTEWFNKRLLERLYREHDRAVAGVHLDREYGVITGDDDPYHDELAADLATDGLDIDEIESEMVSWSTMRHHLKDCLGAEKASTDATTDWERDSVRIAAERTEEKARSVLSSLDSKERLPGATEATVDVQVKLGCPDCSVRVPFEDAMERGYVCETHTEPDEGRRLRDRLSNALAGVAVPYGIAEIAGTFAEDPLIAELATATLF